MGVLILCGAFVLLTVGAVGESGRRRAKEVVCQANLHQWGRYFQGCIQQNNGTVFSASNELGYWWPIQLPHEVQNWRKNRTWFCPVATKPIYDETGRLSLLRKDSAWGVYGANNGAPTSVAAHGNVFTLNPSGLSGSFTLNGYMVNIPDWSSYEGGKPAAYGWRDLLHVPNADTVPMFLDALRFDVWPDYMDQPALGEMWEWPGTRMAGCCIDRHEGAVNCLFLDGSVRKVGLKELWRLKWHRSFNTTGPWTTAGGVLPGHWPEWMKPFKDY